MKEPEDKSPTLFQRFCSGWFEFAYTLLALYFGLPFAVLFALAFALLPIAYILYVALFAEWHEALYMLLVLVLAIVIFLKSSNTQSGESKPIRGRHVISEEDARRRAISRLNLPRKRQ